MLVIVCALKYYAENKPSLTKSWCLTYYCFYIKNKKMIYRGKSDPALYF